MAEGLDKTVVPIQLGMGIDTKTDKKFVIPGMATRLENCVFKKKNRLDKRPGNDRLPNIDVNNQTIGNPESLEVFNDELLQYAGQRLYSYSSGSQKWVDKGPVVSALVRTTPVVRNTAEQSQVDSNSNQGVTVYAWEDSRGGVRATAVDDETGNALLSDIELDNTATRAKVVAFSAFLYVFYYNDGSLWVRRFNPKNPIEFDTAVEVSDLVSVTNPTYDVYAYGTLRMFWAHNAETGPGTVFGWLDDVPTVVQGVLQPFQIAEASDNCLALVLGPNNTFYIAYHNSSDGLRGLILNNGGGTVHGPFDIEDITMDDVVNVTGYKLPDLSGVRFFYEVAAADADDQVVRVNTVNSDGTIDMPIDFVRSVGLWAKAWNYTDASGQTNSYVGLVHESTLQSTFFVARSDAVIVAKQQAGIASGLTSRPILQEIWTREAGIFSYAILTKTRLISENANLFTQTGVSKTTLDFTNQDIFTSAQLGNNLHIVGGILAMYDGQSVVEHGFHLYPEKITTTTNGSSGVPDGSYQYIALYEWTDNYGQIHRSAPSIPVDAVVSGGPKNVVVTVDTLRITAKRDERTDVSIVLYRTEAGPGDIFYRVSSIASPSFNDPTDDSIDITDTTDNTAILSNEILYTTGGNLDNMGPPACSAITVFKNRIFLTGLEDQNSVWYSKEHKIGLPVEFSEEFTQSVEPKGGGLTGAFVLDDKLLYFKIDRYFYTFGDGPNDTGQGGSFAEPVFHTADVGCVNGSTISRAPVGIMLKTQKGIYHIDPNLTPLYVGDQVEAYNQYDVTSAVLTPDTNQVRFTTRTGPCLVYDYYMKQWSVFTGYQAIDAVLWQNRYVILKTNGIVWRENPAIFKDDGASIRIKIELGWLALAGVVGFQRVYKYAILGEYKSPHKIKVSVGYDFSEAYTDAEVFDPTEELEITSFGEESPYGSGVLYGGPNIAYRYVSALAQQKCQAVRFLIEELSTAADPGTQEAFNLSTIGLLVGVKKGMGKLKTSLNRGIGS